MKKTPLIVALIAFPILAFAQWEVPIATTDTVYEYAHFQHVNNHMYHAGADIGGTNDLETTLVRATAVGNVVSVYGLSPGGAENAPNDRCNDGDPNTMDGNEQIRLWDDANGNRLLEAATELSNAADLISADPATKLATCTGRNTSNHGLGIALIIDHGAGEYSLYGHLSAIRKDIWDQVVSGGTYSVAQGEAIGVVGHSYKIELYCCADPNLSFAPHLHFEIKKSASLSSAYDDFYWGYTPDLPNAYGYIDPKEKLFPPDPISTESVVIKIVGNEAGSDNRGARVQSLPGPIYDTFGWTGLDQRFFSDQQVADANVPGRIWYRIHLPNRAPNYQSSEPVTGWIASKKSDGTILAEEDAEPATIIEVDNDGNGSDLSFLRLDPTVSCSDPLTPSTCVSVWDDLQTQYKHVRAWNGTRFIRSDTQEVAGVMWHEVYLPKVHFDDPRTACAAAPDNDQCVGDIDRAWLTDDAIRIVDNPNVQDITPPELVSLDLSPTAINVTSGSANVTLRTRIVDDLSGLNNGYVYLYSPSLTQSKTFYLNSSRRVSGTSLDGWYETTATFPQFSEAGDWTIRSATLRDVTTNYRSYDEATLSALGDTVLSVTSNEDNTSPTIQNISFSPTTIDASAGDVSLTLTVDILDDVAGLNYAYFSFRSASGGQNKTVVVRNRIAGNALDGTYQETVTFPQYSEAGDWYIQSVQLYDLGANRWYQREQDLISSGLTTRFAMQSSPTDVQAPELSGLDIAPQVVNTILSPASTAFSIDILENLSGFSSGSISIRSPSGGQSQTVSFSPYYLTSGNLLNGRYENTREFPRYSEFGEWTIRSINLRDRTTNYQYYSTQDIANLGLPSTILMEGIIESGNYSIGSAGGTIATEDGLLTIEFPVNALSQLTTISITQVGRFDPVDIWGNNGLGLGTVLAEYDFQPDGLSFSSPVTVTMNVDVTALNQGERNELAVYLHTDTDNDGTPDTFVPIDAAQVLSISTIYNSDGTTTMVFVVQLDHFSTYAVILPIETADTEAPDVQITVPQVDEIIQDGVTLVVNVNDQSDVRSTHLTIREADGGEGVSIGYEDLSAAQIPGTDRWELNFDTSSLVDGNYIIYARAIDEYGNEGRSSTVPFSIRNWSLVDLLPASKTYRAGRTMPLKFSLRVSAFVNANAPAVRNEGLLVKVYETANPTAILQSSTFGEKSTDYRISSDAALYITNFKTSKRPTAYTVEVWRVDQDYLVGSFSFETARK